MSGKAPAPRDGVPRPGGGFSKRRKNRKMRRFPEAARGFPVRK
jgi:hypothetical protein